MIYLLAILPIYIFIGFIMYQLMTVYPSRPEKFLIRIIISLFWPIAFIYSFFAE